MKSILLLASAALVLSGCATSYGIAPQAAEGQGVRYERGTPTLVSVKEHGVLRVSPAAKSYTDRVVLNVVAFNNGPNPANIGYENISAATAAGEPLGLFTVAMLEREAKTRAAWGAFAIALAGAANAYAAQQSAYSYGSGSVHTYTPYGGIHSTYNYRSYNPALANALTQRATDDAAAGIGQISAALDQTLQSLDGRILQTTTIDVGHIDGGQIVLAKPKMEKAALTDFIVRVAFNGDTHEFRFRAGAEHSIAQLPPSLAPLAAVPALASREVPAGSPPADSRVGVQRVVSRETPAPEPRPAAPKRCALRSTFNPDAVTC